MDLKLLKLHSRLFLLVICLITAFLVIAGMNSVPKAQHDIEWMDVSGEGGITLITLIWIFFMLISRPAGKVTNLLVGGLTLVHISLLADLMDEFLIYPEAHYWFTAWESIPAPVGLIIMTLGLYHWHKEQLSMNNQLRRRERFYRNHGLIDYITGLYTADYMIEQINNELQQPNSKPFSLLMLDIDKFDDFIQTWGDRQGDRLLRELSELILMNIRITDLACRYAGDRFIIILPDTRPDDAKQLALQLEQAITHFAFKPEQTTRASYLSISTSSCPAHIGDSTRQLINQLNESMEHQKLLKAGFQV